MTSSHAEASAAHLRALVAECVLAHYRLSEPIDALRRRLPAPEDQKFNSDLPAARRLTAQLLGNLKY